MNTLIVKNISSKLSYSDREDLFRHFGAKCVTNLPNHSLIVFESEVSAREAITRLHQLLVLGQRLRVEFAVNCRPSAVNQLPDLNEPHLQQRLSAERVEAFKDLKLRQFVNQFNYISPALGLNYLPSPLLRYTYPSATPHIVNNIAQTLLSHPRFYTQVLHLMNKMNLPVPFGPGSQHDLNLPNISPINTNVDNFYTNNVLIGSSESELEASDTEVNVRPFETKVFTPKKKVVKKLKTGFVGEKAVFITQTSEPKAKQKCKSSEQMESVFEVPNTCEPKPNIEVNIVSDCRALNQLSDWRVKAPAVQSSGFGLLDAVKQKPIENSVPMDWDLNDIISDEELSSNRILKTQWIKYPVFKGYTSGQTSCRLYIKNIDKSVETKDLMRIYTLFIDFESQLHRNMFDIRLMKTGRMKGQAFITFPDELIAEKALSATNGYLFNDKPIVVAFARSVRPKEMNQ